MITPPRAPRTARRRIRRRWLVLAAITAVVVLALVVAAVLTSRGNPESRSRVSVARCHQQAGRLPAPWKFSGKRSGGAAPPSPFTGTGMYVPPDPSARAAASAAQRSGNTGEAARLRRIAAQPRATWVADSSARGQQLADQVSRVVSRARQQNRVATLVAYNIPLRDCGGYSAGGAPSGAAYVRWIKSFIFGLQQGGVAAGPGVAVILEPDALGLMNNLPPDRRAERLDLLRAATTWLSEVPGTAVYLDAGTVGWLSPQLAAQRLSRAGVAHARGFSLNVSNFHRADAVTTYGRRISAQVGWKSFVIDTGRSGNGALRGTKQNWCNPPGRALGPTPRADPARNVDAYLWVKPPGESDGACGPHEPRAGQFWPAYADQLAKNAGW